MQTIEMPRVETELRTPNYPLVDLRAAADAAAALQSAARTRQDDGVLATALTWASAVLNVGADTQTARVVASPEFLSHLRGWIHGLRQVAAARPETGACTIASALELWSWTMRHFIEPPQNVVDELAAVLSPLLAARCFAIEAASPSNASAADLELRNDLSRVYAARTAASAAATCAELVFGYRRHLVWDAEGIATCYAADELDALEGFIPGIACGARTSIDVIEADGSHAPKAGPCAHFDGVEDFVQLRSRLDGCLTGARIAKDRAAIALGSSQRRV